MLKLIRDLDLGKLDAVGYQDRKRKNYFSNVFLVDENLDKILEEDRYFLVGEKGSGKTAYGTYIVNNSPNKISSSIINIQTTDYEKFLNLHKEGVKQISTYEDFWRVIILLLIAEKLGRTIKGKIFNTEKLEILNIAIDNYYSSAFDPEIVNALKLIENSSTFAEVLAGTPDFGARFGIDFRESMESESLKFNSSLSQIEKVFKEAISDLKIDNNQILFIDGIDVRPDKINYDEYLNCISSLSHALWQLNTGFLNNIRDSKGRIKIVILMRPDIFEAVNFQNSNSKLRDNGVYLQWGTTYQNFRNSKIFAVIDRLLAKQEGHPKLNDGDAWRHYFNFDITNYRVAEKIDDPFIHFLRNSLYRPRDIIAYVNILKDYVSEIRNDASHFIPDDLVECQQEYSDYLFGEIKDYMSFYYNPTAFEQFHGFFNYLSGRSKFSWDQFESAYKLFTEEKDRSITLDRIRGGTSTFLQFLYEMNVIGYAESPKDGVGKFIHWNFRDRTIAKLKPQIPIELRSAESYHIHPGLVRALKLGAERE